MANANYALLVATNARKVDALTVQIGAEMRSQRKRRGMTQVQLARASGIADSVISRMENGDAAIDVAQLSAIAKAFTLAPEELLFAARKSAEAAEATLYRSDGSLDPAQIRTVPAPDEEFDSPADG